MPSPRLASLIGLLACGAAAHGQTIVTSPRPDDVDVTVYRDPNRPAAQQPNLEWLNGYALISERRQVTIPAGESDLRFEGVAGGIVPQSAIVTGLAGIVERNRDAYLLSSATLLDRSLGRRVQLRRTSRATGQVRTQEAIIRSSADGAVVLQTRDGFQALRCSGLAETLTYDQVPPDLSARPTLSVRARSSRPVTATVTLSYLATGFDWQADYVATLSVDETRLDLFAWLTLASIDETSFPDADTQAVAGRLNREGVEPEPAESGPLVLRCWPEGTTSDLPLPPEPVARGRTAVVADEEYALAASVNVESVITNLPQVFARQEDLADLKLYRIPEPVTVAANSQKQVAFLQRSDVQVRLVYRWSVLTNAVQDARPTRRVLVSRNRAAEGLGIPLPAGQIRLFTDAAERPILIGQGSIEDRAVGEDVEIDIGAATGVTSRVERGVDSGSYRLVVTNDRTEPIPLEVEFHVEAGSNFRTPSRLSRRDGRPLWAIEVPANGTASLSYRLTRRNG